MSMLRALRRHQITAVLAAAGLSAAGVGTARAADAPTRTIAFWDDGTLRSGLRAAGVSGDGREVMLNTGGRVLLRDVAAGATRTLAANSSVAAVSDDLQRVLMWMDRA